MVNQNILYTISTALLVVMLTGCGTGNHTNSSMKGAQAVTVKEHEIAAQFHSAFEIKPDKNNMIIHYNVKNISGKTKTLTFSSGLEADYSVYDSAGKKVKQYSDDVLSTQAIKKITLKNNQEMNKQFTISDLPNGQYKLELYLTAKEEEAKVVTNLIIKNSFTITSGVYVGQMDSHTIEMDMNGNKEAFQLTISAQQQLTTLKEGQLVSFTYRENNLGQKMIEKFE